MTLARRFVAALLAITLAVAAQAQPVAPAPTLRDDRGVAIVLPAVPQRIVSLLPSLTESLCALGACARLVGTDRYSNWPASVASLPKLGGIDDAQIERIVALRPDLVVVSASARLTDRLEGLGIQVAVLESRNHADVRRSLVLLARILGEPATAERVWAGIEATTSAAAARVPARLHGKRVYFEIDATPYAAGAGSFIGESLARLGLGNAIGAELGPFPKLNPEYVVRLQPDIVMAAENNLATMARRPGWSQLHALRDRQVCAFAGERYELLVRPGPRMGEAAALLADCLAALPALP